MNLSHCPFCGGSPEMMDNGIGDHFVACSECRSRTSDSNCESRQAAAERWNKRASAEQFRVPQYDDELNCAAALVGEWKSVAIQLRDAIGCGRREQRRIAAENAFAKLMKREAKP